MEALIIDDESLVLDGLKLLINRFDASIDIKCFLDVDEALLYVQSHQPDIIISDIEMPKLNGIQLCQKIKELCKAEIIIISGFENFTYAKNAVELGALSYVLKPINQNEFIGVLKTAMNKIEKNKTMDREFIKKNQIIRSKILSDIANGFNTTTLIKNELSDLGKEVINCYTVAIMTLDDAYCIPSFQNNKDFEKTYGKLYKIINSLIETRHLNVYFSEAQPGKFIFLSMDTRETGYKFLNELTGLLKDRLDIGATTGLSNAHKDINDIFKAYDEALLVMQKEFLGDKNSIYVYNKEFADKIYSNINKKEYLFNLKKLNYYQNNLCGMIVGNDDLKQLEQSVNLLFDDIRQFGSSFESICRFCEELLLLIIFNFFKTFEHNSLSLDDIIKYCNTIQLKESAALPDLKISFLKSLKSLAEIIRYEIAHKIDPIKVKVDNYLSANCSSITLQNAADAVGLNPTYFSILFKQKFGMNFKDYILDYKMELAKSMLLDPSIKISEISEKIGYPDSNYFSKVYKKLMGISPSEYRNNAFETKTQN